MKTIQLTQGMIAIVDDEDYDRLSQHKWCAMNVGRQWSAVREGPRRLNGRWKTGRADKFYMHRVILNAPVGIQVDHIHKDDGVIDNRKENMRLATASQNNRNRRGQLNTSSRFKGAYRCVKTSRWAASIGVKGKWKHLGYFDDEEDAALAYDAAARILHGEFAHTNFPYIFVV